MEISIEHYNKMAERLTELEYLLAEHGCQYQNHIRRVKSMDDLISRQAAIELFERELSARYNKRELAIGFIGSKSILENVPSAQSWISGMPEEYGNYLVTVEDKKGDRWVDIDYYTSYGWDDYSESDGWKVYAWMPLPKVWEGEEHENKGD